MSGEGNGFLGTVFAFLTGAAIGAGLALLYAPQSGEETRKKLKELSEKVADDVKDHYEKLHKETQKAIESVKSTSEKAVGQIKTFIEGAKEGLVKEQKKAKTKAAPEEKA